MQLGKGGEIFSLGTPRYSRYTIGHIQSPTCAVMCHLEKPRRVLLAKTRRRFDQDYSCLPESAGQVGHRSKILAAALVNPAPVGDGRFYTQHGAL
jgi:hypothetical protein